MAVVRSVKIASWKRPPAASKTSSTIRTQNHSKENDAPNSSAPWKKWPTTYVDMGRYQLPKNCWLYSDPKAVNKLFSDRWNAHRGVFCQRVPGCTWAINVGSNVSPWSLHHSITTTWILAECWMFSLGCWHLRSWIMPRWLWFENWVSQWTLKISPISRLKDVRVSLQVRY